MTHAFLSFPFLSFPFLTFLNAALLSKSSPCLCHGTNQHQHNNHSFFIDSWIRSCQHFTLALALIHIGDESSAYRSIQGAKGGYASSPKKMAQYHDVLAKLGVPDLSM